MTKFKQKSNVLLMRMLFLLAMLLTGSSASWADNYLVLKPSITIGNENGWAGDHIDASFFADIKANDVIEISKVSGTNNALQVSAGTWDNSVQLFNEYNWNGETQYIRILAPSSSSSSNDDIVNLIKTNGLIVNGNGPCNIKVRLILVGDNRLSPSGTFSKTGITNNVAQIGDAVTYKYTLDSKFANAENVKYRWFIVNQSDTDAPELPEGDGYVYGYNQMLNGYKWGTSNTFTFIPRESTAGKKLRVCLHVEADGLSTNYTYDNSGDFTIAPMQTPAIVQDGTSVKITVPANHWLKYSINGGEQESVYTNSATVTDLNNGDIVQAWTYRTVTVNGSDRYPHSESVSLTYVAPKPALEITGGWDITMPSNTKGWGVPTYTVKANGQTVDQSQYSLKFEVTDADPIITIVNGGISVKDGYNSTGTAHVKVTAVPNNPSQYSEGSTTFVVNIKPIAEPKITVTPSKTVRIGEAVTLGVTRNSGFYDISYDWTLSDNAKTCLWGYDGSTINTPQAANAASPTLTFVAKEATSSPIEVNMQFHSSNGYYDGSDDNHKLESASLTGWNGITVQPVARPIISEDIEGIHFKVEEDYDGVKISDEVQKVDVYLEYWTEDETFETRHILGYDGNGTGSALDKGEVTISSIGQGKTIHAKAVVAYKDAEGNTHWVASEPVDFVTETAASLPDFEQIKQPRFKRGIAKQYISFTNTMKVVGGDDAGSTVTNVWPSGVNSGKDALTDGNGKKTLGYILGGNSYPYDEAKGICISRFGKAHWAWSSTDEATRQWLPKSGAFFLQVAGTMDVTLYAENTFHNSENTTDGNEGNRRKIKAWYLNDQCKDGKPIEFADWGIVGIRGEGNNVNGNRGNELVLHVRLPQLGTNGIATLFFTYEGDGWGNEANDTNHDLWIKGFMVKRPDLTNSIGRTDNKYTDGDELTNICVSEPNTPYVWSFEPNAKNRKGEDAHKDKKDAVGFRPASDTDSKKSNIHDGRTYICGAKCDHVLVFCDNTDDTSLTPLTADERPEFDGRLSRDGKSHIEFVRPTTIAGNNGNDDKFNPIRSNGLKVNVTGSGWFKAKVSAPNGKVKMKFLTSTNGGMSTIRVLKEFIVEQPEGDNKETAWSEYTAYLKAQLAYDETYDELDATGDPEKQYMSIYVVFEAVDGVTYSGLSNYAQLNIHEMSWLNEEPMDYVFQREENPKLLTELQTIKRGDETVLRWLASNPSIKETLNDVEVATFDINDQKDTKTGPTSFSGKVTSGNTAGYVWDIAAKPAVGSHTEAAQRYTDKYHYTDGTNGTKDTRFVPGNETTEMEFGLPITGSFYRLYPEKNGHVIAYIVPSAANKKIYVLDETGARVDYLNNQSDLTTQPQKARGGVKTVSGATQSDNAFTSQVVNDGTSAIRLDIFVSAGKEYFICGDDAISLAALHWYGTRAGDAEDVTLNNDGTGNSDVITKAQSAQNVGSYTGTMYADATLNREFKEGQWASLVLPFSMNELKFKGVFGDNAICIHFTSVDPATNTVNLTHHYYNMIVAGRPVFVRPSKSFTTADIYDVTLQAGEVIPTVANGITFTGNIDNGTIPANSLFMSGNAIKHTTVEKQNVGAMRVWIEGGSALKDIDKEKTAPVARLLNYDGTLLDGDIATGIESALAEAGMDAAVISASTVIYNLQGNKVATGAEMQNLPAGVYVVKGKKFIVK